MIDAFLEALVPSVPNGVAFDASLHQLTLTATTELSSLNSGAFDEPSSFVSFETDVAHRYIGFSFAQFALPVAGSRATPFNFSPQSNIDAPASVIPLLIESSEGVLLLAPLDSWHEQIIGVRQSGHGITEFRWGWHGDLATVPAGFVSTLGIFHGSSASEAFRRWGQQLLANADTRRIERQTHVLTSKLSYWTDNGAAYWYRTEPGLDIATTLEHKLSELDELGIDIGAVELDSWFYRHELSRSVSATGYLEEVPPTPMLSWKPRTDVLPGGINELATRLGNRALALHARHISTQSPYLDHGDWWVDVGAHPVDPDRFFEQWCVDAREWGATCIEQDWMLHVWFGVRQLREAPGRAMAWQHGLDAAAGRHGLGLLWCMATPGDIMATVELDNIIAIRTSDDYRYADDPAFLWRWYLTVNRFVAALDLVAFKDCFFTNADPGDSAIDGDPHAELEALLSAMSAGVAGIGDRIGRTDPAIIERLCDDQGRLVQPDRPIAIADQSFFENRVTTTNLLWATARSGAWRYVVAIHDSANTESITDRFDLGDEYLVYDWRTGMAEPTSEIAVELAHRAWKLFVVCPIETDSSGQRHAIIGDVGRYATMGHLRFDDSAPDMQTWTETAQP